MTTKTVTTSLDGDAMAHLVRDETGDEHYREVVVTGPGMRLHQPGPEQADRPLGWAVLDLP